MRVLPDGRLSSVALSRTGGVAGSGNRKGDRSRGGDRDSTKSEKTDPAMRERAVVVRGRMGRLVNLLQVLQKGVEAEFEPCLVELLQENEKLRARDAMREEQVHTLKRCITRQQDETRSLHARVRR